MAGLEGDAARGGELAYRDELVAHRDKLGNEGLGRLGGEVVRRVDEYGRAVKDLVADGLADLFGVLYLQSSVSIDQSISAIP